MVQALKFKYIPHHQLLTKQVLARKEVSCTGTLLSLPMLVMGSEGKSFCSEQLFLKLNSMSPITPVASQLLALWRQTQCPVHTLGFRCPIHYFACKCLMTTVVVWLSQYCTV